MTPQSPDQGKDSNVFEVLRHDSGSNRIFSLDVIRGIALMGILLISIWEFGGFSQNEQTRLRLLEKGNNYHLFLWMIILFEGKMRALFSLVFGAGIMLYLAKPNQPHLPGTQELYIRRQMWLIGFGLVNAFILLWPHDILFQYGVMGILLFPFFRMSPRSLLIAALVVTLIYCGKIYWNYADDRKALRKYRVVTLVEDKFRKDSANRHQKDSLSGITKRELAVKDSLAKKNDTLTRRQQMDKDAWEGKVKGMKFDSTRSAEKAETKAMGGSYAKVWDHLLRNSQGYQSDWLYRVGIWDIGSLMLMGMSLMGFGFFGGKRSRTEYLLIALIGIAAGVLLAMLRVHLQHDKLADYAKFIDHNGIGPNQFYPVERLLMATGYASLIILLVGTGASNWLWKALAAAGKMAFTNYILQTMLCTFFFYGYGFGYFGSLTQVQLYFLVAEIWLVQIVFSVFWLRYFHYGPLEWLWRCLTYTKKIPNRKEPGKH